MNLIYSIKIENGKIIDIENYPIDEQENIKKIVPIDYVNQFLDNNQIVVIGLSKNLCLEAQNKNFFSFKENGNYFTNFTIKNTNIFNEVEKYLNNLNNKYRNEAIKIFDEYFKLGLDKKAIYGKTLTDDEVIEFIKEIVAFLISLLTLICTVAMFDYVFLVGKNISIDLTAGARILSYDFIKYLFYYFVKLYNNDDSIDVTINDVVKGFNTALKKNVESNKKDIIEIIDSLRSFKMSPLYIRNVANVPSFTDEEDFSKNLIKRFLLDLFEHKYSYFENFLKIENNPIILRLLNFFYFFNFSFSEKELTTNLIEKLEKLLLVYSKFDYEGLKKAILQFFQEYVIGPSVLLLNKFADSVIKSFVSLFSNYTKKADNEIYIVVSKQLTFILSRKKNELKYVYDGKTKIVNYDKGKALHIFFSILKDLISKSLFNELLHYYVDFFKNYSSKRMKIAIKEDIDFDLEEIQFNILKKFKNLSKNILPIVIDNDLKNVEKNCDLLRINKNTRLKIIGYNVILKMLFRIEEIISKIDIKGG